MKPTVISTFAGCGGSSLGYKMAGYKELLAVELDDHAVKIFKMNFPEVLIWKKDVSKLTGKEIMDHVEISKGELDVFDGSPPCQGFSTSGKRQVCDVRNDLVGHYIRLVGELQPKVFIMENVSGMVKGIMKGVFIDYVKQMKKLDYNVSCRLVNAKWLGVAQSRRRIICIGVRKDIGVPVFPKAHDAIITVKEATINCTPLTAGTKLSAWELKHYKLIKPGECFSKIINSAYSMCKIDLNKPCRSIPKSIAYGGHAYLYHPIEERGLSIEEAKRIQSFPDDFKFIGEFEDQWARIGNSVPPLMMKAISGRIKDEYFS